MGKEDIGVGPFPKYQIRLRDHVVVVPSQTQKKRFRDVQIIGVETHDNPKIDYVRI